MDDSRIVQLYWDRDEEAIPASEEKYGGYCTVIAVNILASREDAEECVNDTWMNAWNTIPPRRPHLLRTFLVKLTRNLALNRYKHNTADKRGGGELPLVFDELDGCVSGKEDIQQSFDRRELMSAVNDFLATLPMKKRQLFVCRYWYADGVAQIAARFGMSEGAVSMTLSRLRERLREYLTERGFVL